MAIKPDWTLGTLTLTAGSAAFTTTGSALKSADIQGGDTLITQSGLVLVIATITGENSGTLYMPCPSVAAGFDQPLRVRYQSDASRLPAATRHLLNELSSGNIAAFAELVGQAGMVPIFTGAGILELVPTEKVGGMQAGDYDPSGKKRDVYAMDNMVEGERGLILSPDERQDIASAKRDRHVHDNSQVLDDTSESFTTPLKSKLDALPDDADKTTTASVGAALAGPTPSTGLNDGDKFGGILAGGAKTAIWSWATVKAAIKLFTDTLYASKTQGGKADSAVQPDAMTTALTAKQDKLNFVPANKAGDEGLGGFQSIGKPLGNLGGATTTLSPAVSNYQHGINNGAFTLIAPPDGYYGLSIKITNAAAGAGAMTAIGFNAVGTFSVNAGKVQRLLIDVSGDNKIMSIVEAS